MSTTLILHESTMATSPLIFSSRESMYTTMRPPADGRITSFLGSLAM
ncbi:hypothetical protein LINPERHAP2_LOCUS24973 [Linum perenne]